MCRILCSLSLDLMRNSTINVRISFAFNIYCSTLNIFLLPGSGLLGDGHHGDQEDQHGAGGHHGDGAAEVPRPQEQSDHQHLVTRTILEKLKFVPKLRKNICLHYN